MYQVPCPMKVLFRIVCEDIVSEVCITVPEIEEGEKTLEVCRYGDFLISCRTKDMYLYLCVLQNVKLINFKVLRRFYVSLLHNLTEINRHVRLLLYCNCYRTVQGEPSCEQIDLTLPKESCIEIVYGYAHGANEHPHH